MSRRITLTNATDCDLNNPYFKVFVSDTKTLMFLDILSSYDYIGYPTKVEGYLVTVSDVVNVSDSFISLGINTDYLINLIDILPNISDSFSNKGIKKKYNLEFVDTVFVLDSDRISTKNTKVYNLSFVDSIDSPQDTFATVKEQRLKFLSFTDTVNISD